MQNPSNTSISENGGETMVKDNPTITITPPIMGTKEAPNPRYVGLTMPVEVFLNHGVYDEEVTEGERFQYNFQKVVHGISDDLHRMAEFNEVKHWPEGILVVAATALLTANTALKQWLRED